MGYERDVRRLVTVGVENRIKIIAFNIKHNQHPIRATMAIMGDGSYYDYLFKNVGPRYVFISLYVCEVMY